MGEVRKVLPPGPERRAWMLERGKNISPLDYTPEEWAELGRVADAAAAARRDEPGQPWPFPTATP